MIPSIFFFLNKWTQVASTANLCIWWVTLPAGLERRDHRKHSPVGGVDLVSGRSAHYSWPTFWTPHHYQNPWPAYIQTHPYKWAIIMMISIFILWYKRKPVTIIIDKLIMITWSNTRPIQQMNELSTFSHRGPISYQYQLETHYYLALVTNKELRQTSWFHYDGRGHH